MKLLTLTLSFFLATVLALPLQAEEAPRKVKLIELRDGLHLIQGVLIIDDDYAEYAAVYQQALDTLVGEGTVPAYVLNTHWHWDHTGGNNYWGGKGATIVAHDNVRQRMSTRQTIKAFDRVVEPSPAAALPVLTFNDALALHFNGDTLEVQHLPKGHTDGDSVVYFVAANVLHMGDHFFKDRFPFVDLDSGGSVSGYIANVERALERVDDDTVIVPGHGSPANRSDLERYHRMLVETSTAVKTALAEGKSVDEIVAAGLGGKWAEWGDGFIKEDSWIGFIARSL